MQANALITCYTENHIPLLKVPIHVWFTAKNGVQIRSHSDYLEALLKFISNEKLYFLIERWSILDIFPKEEMIFDWAKFKVKPNSWIWFTNGPEITRINVGLTLLNGGKETPSLKEMIRLYEHGVGQNVFEAIINYSHINP